MRQTLKLNDEKSLHIRTLSVNYAANGKVHSHAHTWSQLLYAQSGALSAVIGNQALMVPHGRALLIPAGTKHTLKMLNSIEMRTLYFNPELRLARETSVLNINNFLRALIIQACQMQTLDERNIRDKSIIHLIMDEIDKAGSATHALTIPRDKRAHALAHRFMDQVGALPMQDLAYHLREVGLTRRTAERLFQKETGLSPARWRRMLLLSYGFEHIASGGMIDTAAELAGYATRAAFTDAFTKTFGFSPRYVKP